MSILRKLDALVAADRQPLEEWKVHANVIRDIIRQFKFAPIDLITRTQIEQLVFSAFGDTVQCSWDNTLGRPNLIIRGELFGDRVIYFLL